MLAAAPALPKGCGTLWRYFVELHSCRGKTQAGVMPVTFSDIDAWQRVRGVSLEPWEVECIRRADAAYLRSVKRD